MPTHVNTRLYRSALRFCAVCYVAAGLLISRISYLTAGSPGVLIAAEFMRAVG